MNHKIFTILISLSIISVLVLSSGIINFIFLSKKNLPENKKKISIISRILILLYFVAQITILIFPVDNYFFKFDSIKEEFNYYYPKETIINITSKDNYYFISCLDNKKDFTSYIAIKQNNNWKFKYASLSSKKDGSISIFLHKVSKSNLYFLIIKDEKNNDLLITDTLNSKFEKFLINEDTPENFAYVTSIKLNKEEAENYYIYVNNKKIKVFNNFKTIKE